MSGHLTVQVLDTARGCPAAGMRLSLYRVDTQDGSPIVLKDSVIDASGTTGEHLLGVGELAAGLYAVEFEVGEYFERILGKSPFLGTVPVMFKVEDATLAWKIAFQCSPWTYSVNRSF